MEWLISNKFDVNAIPNYNCSEKYATAAEWTKNEGTPRIILGVLDIVFGFSIEIAYGLCVFVMLQRENIKYSCFKIMALLGCIDMCALVINSIIGGFLMIEGAVYCSHPLLIFIAGAFGLGFWCAACLICLILVINRVLDILFPVAANKYFSGSRTSIILAVPISYGILLMLFTPPPLFTSHLQSWFFDPFIYEGRTLDYKNYPHTINNLFIVVATCFLYGYFCFALSELFKKKIPSNNKKVHTQIFLQSSIICLVNFLASVVFVYMQFFPVPDIFIVIGQVSYQLVHGCPAIIYLSMNTTIRHGLKRIFCKKTSSELPIVFSHSMGIVNQKSSRSKSSVGHTSSLMI